MEKSLTLFLSLLFWTWGICQNTPNTDIKCDCSNKHIQDSLVLKYIDKGAYELPYMYNDPNWILYCDSVINICPNIAYAYQQKALPFIKNGDYQKAFLLENKAVDLEPQNYISYRGFLKCIFTKDYFGAIIDFKQAEKLSPNGYEMDHTFSFWQGVCNLELGNYSKAIKNFELDCFIQTKGDTTQAPHFNSLFYLGVLYYEMENFSLAKKHLMQCLNEYELHTNANYYLAMVFRSENNLVLSKKYLEISKQAFEQGYGINEDNVYYVNYPHQIRFYEVEKALLNE